MTQPDDTTTNCTTAAQIPGNPLKLNQLIKHLHITLIILTILETLVLHTRCRGFTTPACTSLIRPGEARETLVMRSPGPYLRPNKIPTTINKTIIERIKYLTPNIVVSETAENETKQGRRRRRSNFLTSKKMTTNDQTLPDNQATNTNDTQGATNTLEPIKKKQKSTPDNMDVQQEVTSPSTDELYQRIYHSPPYVLKSPVYQQEED